MGRKYNTRHTSYKRPEKVKEDWLDGLFHTYGMTHTEVYKRSN